MKYFILFLFLYPKLLFSQTQPLDVVQAYGDLYDSVQLNEVFADQKKFIDCPPLRPLTEIKADYYLQRNRRNFNLPQFIAENFDTTFIDTTSLLKHINYLWDYLTRYPEPKPSKNAGSLIPLPSPYIVPGGRFREIYYWDSYFTILGLRVAGKDSLIEAMLNNFNYLILEYGHIPNGNRTYYLSRSQPPFFSYMVELYAEMQESNEASKNVYQTYRPALLKEYHFWMEGKKSLSPKHRSEKHVVLLEKETVLNRYWDELCTPRPESFKQDVSLKIGSGRDSTIYRDIRSAAESGWDFSSRWLNANQQMESIQTTQIIPVDLNSLLYNLEVILSSTAPTLKENEFYAALAEQRKNAIIKYCWDDSLECFGDFNFIQQKNTGIPSLAMLYPLFAGIATQEQAYRSHETIKTNFLKPGGLVTTLHTTGEQWDSPNGWAPLQWIAYRSFVNYNYLPLANQIANRWIHLNVKVYFDTHKMMEKYDVVDLHRKGGGGEYPLQDGFGWTNGVFLALWDALH